jgi:phosphoribosyl 1,2-cyclic phosphate phosphodiesterase
MQPAAHRARPKREALVLRVVILGSAAAEGWPAMFCTCDACKTAARRGGKDIRRRTSYRINDTLQVDWGPDTYGACLAFNVPTDTVTDLVMTHAHEDHWTPHELYYRRPGFSLVPEENVLTIYGSQAVADAMEPGLLGEAERFRLAFRQVAPYETVTTTQGDSFTALPANHMGENSGAYNLIFHLGPHNLLIANDTGWWKPEVWDFVGAHKLDVVIMDCTYGLQANRHGHLGAPDVVEAKQELASRGALVEGGRYVANHFSHNGAGLYDDLTRVLSPHGIEVGYDGMTIEL